MTHYLFNKCISIATHCIFHQQEFSFKRLWKHFSSPGGYTGFCHFHLICKWSQKEKETVDRVDPCTFPPPLSLSLSSVFSSWEQSSLNEGGSSGRKLHTSGFNISFFRSVCPSVVIWPRIDCSSSPAVQHIDLHTHATFYHMMNVYITLSGGKRHLNAECYTVNVLDFLHYY